MPVCLPVAIAMVAAAIPNYTIHDTMEPFITAQNAFS